MEKIEILWKPIKTIISGIHSEIVKYNNQVFKLEYINTSNGGSTMALISVRTVNGDWVKIADHALLGVDLVSYVSKPEEKRQDWLRIRPIMYTFIESVY